VTERPLNISLSLSMTFVAEADRAERQIRRSNSALNTLQSLEIRFGLRRPAISKRAGQYFEPLNFWRRNYFFLF
jgi:hypothetical protein